MLATLYYTTDKQNTVIFPCKQLKDRVAWYFYLNLKINNSQIIFKNRHIIYEADVTSLFQENLISTYITIDCTKVYDLQSVRHVIRVDLIVTSACFSLVIFQQIARRALDTIAFMLYDFFEPGSIVLISYQCDATLNFDIQKSI